METHEKRTGFTSALGKIPAILVTAVIAALSAECAPQTTEPSQVVTAAPPPALARTKATEPITIEMTQAGEVVRVTGPNGAPFKRQNYAAERQRNFLFGKGMM